MNKYFKFISSGFMNKFVVKKLQLLSNKARLLVRKKQVKDMNIYYQNVNGIRTDNTFRDNVEKTDYDIIMLTETKLNEEFSGNFFFDNRYKVFFRHRWDSYSGGIGGGVLIAVKIKSFTIIRKRKWENRDTEDLWIKLTTPQGTVLNVCSVYLEPQCLSQYFETFFENFNNRYKESPKEMFLIAGDFNMSAYKDVKKDVTPTTKLTTMQHNMFICQQKQYNKIKNPNGDLLDLVFSNVKCQVKRTKGLTRTDIYHPCLKINFT